MIQENDWMDDAQEAINFGYDLVEDTGRRMSPKRVVQSEDRHLPETQRKVAISTTRDTRRNIVTARWAISKHIDFVVDHKFKPMTGNKDFDGVLKEFVRTMSMRENFDISGRYGLEQYCRLAESASIVDGDFFTVRNRGGVVQAIEGDRIRDITSDPTAQWTAADTAKAQEWVHGVRTNKVGRPLSYAIHRRHQTGFTFESLINAKKVISQGFFDRFDQTRGISPMACVINLIVDLYESYDYALAKAKVAQLFALKITREADWSLAEGDGDDREISFDKGPQILDLDSGEDAAFLKTDTPGAETAEFWQQITGLVLKSLNIPYSFWQEDFSNFHGSRAALVLYMKSVKKDRERTVNFRNDWLCWRLKVGQLLGEIQMPSDFECDPKNWKWIADGVQYWDPAKEASADEMQIAMGTTTRNRVTLEREGDDWDEIYEELLEEETKMAVINKMRTVSTTPIQKPTDSQPKEETNE